jgi:hypothetical protein
MQKPEAEKLADLLLEEIRRPGDVQALYERVGKTFRESHPLPLVLASKDRQHRQAFYLQSEERWFRLFGWTMAKALMLFGLLAAGVFLLARGRVTPDQAATLLFGASAYYMLVYVISLRRYSKNARKIEEGLAGYRAELKEILEELVRDHHLEAGKYRV